VEKGLVRFICSADRIETFRKFIDLVFDNNLSFMEVGFKKNQNLRKTLISFKGSAFELDSAFCGNSRLIKCGLLILAELSNADFDLVKLSDMLAKSREKNFSLCLREPPWLRKKANLSNTRPIR
jgi:hypothetical protein